VADTCEYSNEALGSMNDRECLDKLSNYQLLNKFFVLCSCLWAKNFELYRMPFENRSLISGNMYQEIRSITRLWACRIISMTDNTLMLFPG
jgi:hypothetical protein